MEAKLALTKDAEKQKRWTEGRTSFDFDNGRVGRTTERSEGVILGETKLAFRLLEGNKNLRSNSWYVDDGRAGRTTERSEGVILEGSKSLHFGYWKKIKTYEGNNRYFNINRLGKKLKLFST